MAACLIFQWHDKDRNGGLGQSKEDSGGAVAGLACVYTRTRPSELQPIILLSAVALLVIRLMIDDCQFMICDL